MEISFEHANSSLFAVDTGTGDPVVLLHGGLATHVACRRFAEPLSARHRLITPDLRGSGRSRFAGELTWYQLADHVVALLAHLPLPRAAIGGISAGAAVATRVALRHPAATSALILLTPRRRSAAPTSASCPRRPTPCSAWMPPRAARSSTAPACCSSCSRPSCASARASSSRATTRRAWRRPQRLLASGAQPFDRAGELAAIAAPTSSSPAPTRNTRARSPTCSRATCRQRHRRRRRQTSPAPSRASSTRRSGSRDVVRLLRSGAACGLQTNVEAGLGGARRARERNRDPHRWPLGSLVSIVYAVRRDAQLIGSFSCPRPRGLCPRRVWKHACGRSGRQRQRTE